MAGQPQAGAESRRKETVVAGANDDEVWFVKNDILDNGNDDVAAM